MHNMYWGYGFGGPFEFLFHALLWILVIAIIIKVLKSSWLHDKHHGHHPRDWFGGGNKAIDMLKERYVKGEISKEEYEEKKAVISKE